MSGVTDEDKESRRDDEIRTVEDSAARFEVKFPGTFSTDSGSVPSTLVADSDGDGMIKVKVDSSATDTGQFSGLVEDVLCGDGTGTIADALDECFASIDFSAPVPDFMSTDPAHAGESITITDGGDGADLTITSINRHGDGLEFHTDDDIDARDGLEA